MRRRLFLPTAILVWSCASLGWGATTGTAHVPDSADAVQPLDIGAEIPDVTLVNPQGGAFDLKAAVAKKPTVLIFYRGGW